MQVLGSSTLYPLLFQVPTSNWKRFWSARFGSLKLKPFETKLFKKFKTLHESNLETGAKERFPRSNQMVQEIYKPLSNSFLVWFGFVVYQKWKLKPI